MVDAFYGDSYPYDWIQTLDTAERLDFDLRSVATAT